MTRFRALASRKCCSLLLLRGQSRSRSAEKITSSAIDPLNVSNSLRRQVDRENAIPRHPIMQR
jgi:hypothetical protein